MVYENFNPNGIIQEPSVIGWLLYIGVILAVSGLIGAHLGRFREAYTEMTGMMAGMTMGMLNGFVLGFGSASATNSMFWGNLFGILLGLALGIYFGRPGGLMGIMDGGMGGVMGGSMGAMLSVMIAFPQYGQLLTAALLAVLYLLGMVGLVVLIERSTPGHAALHRLAPFFTRAMAEEAEEVAHRRSERKDRAAGPVGARRGSMEVVGEHQLPVPGERERRLVDYYALLGVARNATPDDISEAYLLRKSEVEGSRGAGARRAQAERLERGLELLTDARKRAAYDHKLAESEATIRSSLADTGGTSVLIEGRKSGYGHDLPNFYSPARQQKSGSGALPMSAPSASQMSRASQVMEAVERDRLAKQPVSRQGTNRANGANVGAQRPSGRRQSSRNSTGQQPVAYARAQGVRHVRAVQQRSWPISWVGGIAIVLILIALSWWVLSSGNLIGLGAGNGPGRARAKLGEVASTSLTGSVQLSLSVNPDPPQPGPASFAIRVTDLTGKPVPGAQLTWSMDMTNMRMGPQSGHMAELGSGKYQARADFDMGGPWRINVEVTKDGQALGSGYFDLEVR
jgi:curved DNA-binding protein CbpA